MMDGLPKMKGKGFIFSYVNQVNIKNVNFDGLNDKEYEFTEVNNINK